VATRYSDRRFTNALYRDRISASAVGASACPVWNGRQHREYAAPDPHGHVAARALSLVPAIHDEATEHPISIGGKYFACP
jgi:hypothetical protein